MRRVVSSPLAASRLEEARRFLRERSSLVCFALAPTRPAVDELVLSLARTEVVLGVTRTTSESLAVSFATRSLARQGLSWSPSLVREAILTSVVRETPVESGLVSAFESPGFVPALRASIDELDRNGVAQRLHESPLLRYVSELSSRYRERMAARGVATYRQLFEAAMEGVASTGPYAALLLDIGCDSALEARWLRSLFSSAAESLWIAAPGESPLATDAIDILPVPTALSSMARFSDRVFEPRERRASEAAVFSSSGADLVERPACASLSSAPNEHLEAVEIARSLLEAARRGIRFDEMAVVLRQEELYGPHLRAAFARADIPASFEGGTARPNPSGRAFVALLEGALRGGSADRLEGYLRAGLLPNAPESETEPKGEANAGTDVDVDVENGARIGEHSDAETDENSCGETQVDDPSTSARAAADRRPLPSPSTWIGLLRKGGVFRRSGASLRDHVRDRLTTLAKPPARATPRERFQAEAVGRLKDRLVPLLSALEALPAEATWAHYRDHLDALARMALRAPDPVLSVLEELPSFDDASVRLGDVVRLLESRLWNLQEPPKEGLPGSVLVTSFEGVRGRFRRHVAVPGLAEKVFPERRPPDPFLPDPVREALHQANPEATLQTASTRQLRERNLLRLVAGTATDSIAFSYPRREVAGGRTRVPSGFALEIARAIGGKIPDLTELAAASRPASNLTLQSPAPDDPETSLDLSEYAESILRDLRGKSPSERLGRARFLLTLAPWLRRTVTRNYLRSQPYWSVADGLFLQDPARASWMARFRLTARALPASTLELYPVCPQRFFYRAILGLAGQDREAAPGRLGPRGYGDLFHQSHAYFVQMWKDGGLSEDATLIEGLLDRAIARAATEHQERAPALIEAVFTRELDRLKVDLHATILECLSAPEAYRPLAADLGFGVDPALHTDPQSFAADLVTRDGYHLRGAIDFVERGQGGSVRVTDFKTGSYNRAISGRERSFQPSLYAAVVASIWKPEVLRSRLLYATTKGEFASRSLVWDERAIDELDRVLGTIDRAIALGTFLPQPEPGACGKCDHRALCGPGEEARTAMKVSPTAAQKRTTEELHWLRRWDPLRDG